MKNLIAKRTDQLINNESGWTSPEHIQYMSDGNFYIANEGIISQVPCIPYIIFVSKIEDKLFFNTSLMGYNNIFNLFSPPVKWVANDVAKFNEVSETSFDSMFTKIEKTEPIEKPRIFIRKECNFINTGVNVTDSSSMVENFLYEIEHPKK